METIIVILVKLGIIYSLDFFYTWQVSNELKALVWLAVLGFALGCVFSVFLGGVGLHSKTSEPEMVMLFGILLVMFIVLSTRFLIAPACTPDFSRYIQDLPDVSGAFIQALVLPILVTFYLFMMGFYPGLRCLVRFLDILEKKQEKKRGYA